jgi:hypothetical protein
MKKVRRSVLSKLKPEITRDEITAKWVEDNKIKVGSKVKVVRKCYIHGVGWENNKMDNCIGEIFDVINIDSDSILLDTKPQNYWFPIESLEPYKEEYSHFTFEDREMFRDKWIRLKMAKNEHKINFISSDSTVSCASWTQTESLSSLFKTHEFVDGTPFGKLKE